MDKGGRAFAGPEKVSDRAKRASEGAVRASLKAGRPGGLQKELNGIHRELDGPLKAQGWLSWEIHGGQDKRKEKNT